MDEPEGVGHTANFPLQAAAVRRALRAEASPARAAAVARFFKTGVGEYGEGDRFLGVTVPTQRTIARRFRDLPLKEADALLQSPIHEDRSTALLILVGQFTRRHTDVQLRERIFRLYMRRLRFINNWDLVDVSAAPIIGGWLASTRRSRRATPGSRVMTAKTTFWCAWPARGTSGPAVSR